MPRSPGPSRVEKRPGSLVRSYILLSALVTLAMTALLGFATGWLVLNDMRLKEQELADQAAKFLYGQILEHQPATGVDAPIETWEESFDYVLAQTRAHIAFKRVNVITLDGVVVFSSERDWRGKTLDDSERAELRSGPLSTRVLEENASFDLGGVAQEPLLESHLAVGKLNLPGRGDTEVVVEIYRSASAFLAELDRSTSIARIIALISFSLMFLAHLGIVLKGKRTIDQRTNELEELSASLERQVEARTKELASSRRLADVGRLAAGVAHEINTPLASIATCAEGLLRSARDEDRAYLGIIRREAFRVKGITRSLMDFGRGTPDPLLEADRRKLRLMDVFTDLQNLVRYDAEAKDVHLETRIQPPDLEVHTDPNVLHQVLLNVTSNALDACSPGGKVEWSAERARETVTIRCVDDGHGISRELLEQVLDPFVTTKEPGKGTGLGLSTAQIATRRLGGTLSIESPGVGKGATVTIVLPVSRYSL